MSVVELDSNNKLRRKQNEVWREKEDGQTIFINIFSPFRCSLLMYVTEDDSVRNVSVPETWGIRVGRIAFNYGRLCSINPK